MTTDSGLNLYKAAMPLLSSIRLDLETYIELYIDKTGSETEMWYFQYALQRMDDEEICRHAFEVVTPEDIKVSDRFQGLSPEEIRGRIEYCFNVYRSLLSAVRDDNAGEMKIAINAAAHCPITSINYEKDPLRSAFAQYAAPVSANGNSLRSCSSPHPAPSRLTKMISALDRQIMEEILRHYRFEVKATGTEKSPSTVISLSNGVDKKELCYQNGKAKCLMTYMLYCASTSSYKTRISFNDFYETRDTTSQKSRSKTANRKASTSQLHAAARLYPYITRYNMNLMNGNEEIEKMWDNGNGLNCSEIRSSFLQPIIEFVTKDLETRYGHVDDVLQDAVLSRLIGPNWRTSNIVLRNISNIVSVDPKLVRIIEGK